MTTHRKKLIEVSLPLDAINVASAHEKSIRVGHPSALHLWWARRPLATCRAVLFALLVDDPSSLPDEFPTEDEQRRERQRLHRIIERIVPWGAINDEHAFGEARFEISKSIARERHESPPDRNNNAAIQSYIEKYAPPVCDPFCGGGSIPLEAQRLGLRARGSDLNPVAVLVSKATCETPNIFHNSPPVNPDCDSNTRWIGSHGLIEDILWYGKWMRDEAYSKIKHLYPQISISSQDVSKRPELKRYEGRNVNVIAWHWARTVTSPDPRLCGLHVPLVRTFVLSSKQGKMVIVKPSICESSMDYSFNIESGSLTEDEVELAKRGTKFGGREADFKCLVSGETIKGSYIKNEGKAGRIGVRLMAVVAEGTRERLYFSPTEHMEKLALDADPTWAPEFNISGSTQYVAVRRYGMNRFDQLFTKRQLVTLTTLSDLVPKARERIYRDAVSSGMNDDHIRLVDGGVGADAYADAVTTYLGLCVSKQANRLSNMCFWDAGGQKVQQVFARQVFPIVWNFCEANPFSNSTGNFMGQLGYLVDVLRSGIPPVTSAAVIQQDAAEASPLLDRALVVTDPPYYDNIPYADISDFFYVWQRKSLVKIWPKLFRNVLTPKDNELVAFSHRHESKEDAENFFMRGISAAFSNIHGSGVSDYPIVVYYAFKQSVASSEGLTSPGWAAFLQGLIDVGYTIEGTWPMRTENAIALKRQMNALASSIVLVCRRRSQDAPVITRAQFRERLLLDLPDAIKHIQDGKVEPVDMAQSILGPGMSIFSSASNVIESDDTSMSVRQAIALINQVRDEIYGNETADYDSATRFCIEWFGKHGWNPASPDDAEKLARANTVSIGYLESAGVLIAKRGIIRLVTRNELPEDWKPNTDKIPTVWECAQHLVRVLVSLSGGVGRAGILYSCMTSQQRDAAKSLAFRLYDLCERNGLSREAQDWNVLVQEWSAIDSIAENVTSSGEQLL